MLMTRNEWISVLNTAKALAEGKNDTCVAMFGFLLEAIKAQPVRRYRLDEDDNEEDEEE